MKKSDLAMIVLIASLSAMMAFVIVGQIPLLRPDPKGVKVPTTTAIEETVTEPDPTVFKESAINPTVQTVIGGGSSDNNE